ncbi:MAG: methyltransferase domain-containing protein [Deltaproteobacteria bacterium]|nr:methyltransferase domain-containing protein [Deltaproteobacteria bacterium]MBI2363847.1 methyltransferase domain-containing protein [Deltaproteobacteria bacterium]MBI3065105.1 methyltransferase domain-containing protein [Deltaproteobacteria bacterium]
MNRESVARDNGSSGAVTSLEAAVLERYGNAAREVEACLCVPGNYDQGLLKVIPDEILAKDYGCGDPSRYIREGETVLDLGSGSGKGCYIMAQIVGAKGKVIGVDFNPPMLELARKYQETIGDRLRYHNVEFRRGKIQDLRTNLELVDQYLHENPVRTVADLAGLEEFEYRIRREQPLVADESIDVIVSNCVLNLVRPEDKKALFTEMYRVLKRGGRVVISDIVSDEPIPEHLAKDPDLWSACVSGAFLEEEFLRAFEDAKFHGIHIEELRSEAYQTVEGIEFRAITVTAYKGKEGPCIERNQAVIYRGPWKQVVDDDNHVLPRGARIAVCEKTFEIYSKPPYQDQFILVPPREQVPRDKAGVFDCSRDHKRHPRETKGMEYNVTQMSDRVCGPDSNCCP